MLRWDDPECRFLVNYVTPVRMSAKERAFSQIQRWIIDGTLQPGEKLLDAELAETLGVSRTPIREACQLLEVQGLVETQPGKETKVTMIEKDDIFKMYSTMAALQALAAEMTATTIVTEQIDQLRAINGSETQVITMEVSDEELAARAQAWVWLPLKATKGALAKYARLVASASRGAVTDLTD